MATAEWIESAARAERRRGPQEITDIHLTHVPRGLPAAEQRERRKAARTVIRRAARKHACPRLADEHAVCLRKGCLTEAREHLDTLGLLEPEPPPPRRKAARERGGKYCTGCERVRPLNQFWRDRNRLDGHATRCKTCSRRARNTTKTSREST